MCADISKNRLPLHIEISEMLAREIKAGILADGTRLPSERKMAEELGVAVGTLRKALLDLTEKQMLERIHGSGNYIRNRGDDKTKQKTIYAFFRLELLEGGGLPTAEVISVDKVKPPSSIPKMSTSKNFYRIRRLRRLNQLDAALEEIWVDVPNGKKIRADDLSDSLYLFYQETLGIWIARAKDSLSVQAIPDWKPKKSGNSKKEIWGFVERQSYDVEGNCREYSRTWFDPSIVRYVSRIE